MARMGDGRGVHRVLVGKPEGKRSLGRPRHRWEDNIKMDLQEVGGGGDGMHLAQDRDRWRELVNTVMNFRGHEICFEKLQETALVCTSEIRTGVWHAGLKRTALVPLLGF